MSTSENVTLTEDEFDFLTDPTTGSQIPVRSFTWSNPDKISVKVINYGATVVSFKIPDCKGHVDDIVMGFDDLKGYQQKNNPYFGATIGRVANRIKNGQFELNGQIYNVTQNHGQHHLHGGARAIDKVMWDYYVDGNKVIMTHVSKDCDEGYPGDVLYQVIFELDIDNRFVIDHRATSTKPTPINLTNHSYFNLAGHGAGKKEIEKHVVLLNADKYTVVDKDAIPTGELKSVANTLFDFQVPIQLGKVLNNPNGGYDHNLCITRGTEQDVAFVARVAHPPTGRVLEVYSNQPGVQFYTSNFLPEENAPLEPKGGESNEAPGTVYALLGKKGAKYSKHGAFCLETQNYPDAINHCNFPNSVLNPGDTYQHTVVYKIWLNKNP